MAVEVAYCGEGLTDAAVARRLIATCGGQPGTDYITTRRPRGKDALDKRLRGLNAVGRCRLILILRDLDADAECGGGLAKTLLPTPHRGTVLRVAVHSIEAWLMADRDALARTFSVPASALPSTPELVARPKHVLLNILRHHARGAARERLGMTGGTHDVQPQLLAARLSDFAANRWEPDRAAAGGHAPSLARALTRLRKLVKLAS